MAHKVEYLITVDQKDQFCKSISGFNNLIKTIEDVSITSSTLTWRELSIQYEVQDGEIQRDKQRFFHAKFTLQKEEQLSKFEDLLRIIRSILSKAGGRPPQILWDGVSSNYAKNAYPIIHEIENTLRKLITKFMLINVGLGWTREAIPKEVQESVRSKETKLGHDYLYEVDFIQLSNFLFKEYATTNTTVLIDRLRQATKIEDLDLDELKNAIPKSNWDRFFSSIVNCENEYLKTRWDKLYDRRNQIAHNKPIGRTEYEEIKRLSDELKPKLLQAIDNLDKLRITEYERELVSENVATTKHTSYAEFLNRWNELHKMLYTVASTLTPESELDNFIKHKGQNVRSLVNVATRDYKLLSNLQRKEIQEILRLRNYMIHEPSVMVPPDTLASNVERIQNFIQILRGKLSEFYEGGLKPSDNLEHDDTDVLDETVDDDETTS
ncbi:hypothetical protein CFBP3846_01749 [Pseudomonas syringae pv. avii]|uniref:Apea-like HEPN domain-containing protein n=1 Tax=Pseudomonas syringae pv. avii TaxID=663959 RepID=A0ABY1U454_PSESX|nr:MULTISPECIES: HEPN domain-containing protein [Pseudomonas syringae group]KWT11147.1 hypothetical protein AL046_17015 [Pseudomonas syringae pv. avii]PHN69512.1 hypothetical protein AO286_18280 [Pseudomonas syringae]POP89383.1 hypothetical protein CXB40_29910 [Pseudomonas syringae pv. avii]RMR24290.1 hypothetical protein ALP89_02245 [Pseudomonas syringae pv. persicae]SOS26175.1 hypothetical protein CFBP3846_01749 [Pseudomonas syringae pv. avii]